MIDAFYCQKQDEATAAVRRYNLVAALVMSDLRHVADAWVNRVHNRPMVEVFSLGESIGTAHTFRELVNNVVTFDIKLHNGPQLLTISIPLPKPQRIEKPGQ